MGRSVNPKFKLLSRKVIYSGRVVHLEKLECEAPGKVKFSRELIKHPGAAVIIPVLPGERFVLVFQHRIAVNGWLLEFPAGTLEKNEKPETCAYRETIEEIGYQPGKLKKLVQFYPAPGISTERMHLFLATELKPAVGQLDDDEFLKVKVIKRKDLERKINRGEIQDAKTIISFYYYLQLKRR